VDTPVESLNSVTVPLNRHLSLRLYRDSQPKCLETAALQKGLVLIYKGKELIEEGIGFGVPVIKYRDKTLFSSNAEISISPKTPPSLEKRFLIDTVSKKRFYKAYVNDQFYKLIHKLFEKAYLGNNHLLSVNNKIMELRESLKIKTEFAKVEPRGIVSLKYTLKETEIQINADFSNLEHDGCLELLLLNEQGANTFQSYSDTDGLRLNGREIGAWGVVQAEKATLSGVGGNLSFSLENKRAARLFRGWESTKNRFAWAGLSYSISPNTDMFKYTIKLNLNKNSAISLKKGSLLFWE
jgi:hypothetical protein